MSRVLLVTGGGRGIGAATALLAARRGYAVAINYQQNRARAEALAAEIAGAGGRAILAQADTANEAEVERMFAQIDRELGRLTALVNNAGIIGPVSRVDSIRADDLRRLLDVNIVGCFLCAREAVRRMSTKHGGGGGGIVNLGSQVTHYGAAGEYVHYAASKGALVPFTVGLAREVAAEGIRVNCVSPGFVDTEIHAPLGGPERMRKVAPMIPQGRAGTAEEVAEAILWLLSDQASYTTGAVIPVSGGR